MTGTFGASFTHLVIDSTDGTTDTFDAGSALDIDGTFKLNAGTYTQGNVNMNVAGGFQIASGAVFTKAVTGSLILGSNGNIQI